MSFDVDTKLLDYSVFSLRQQIRCHKAGTALSSATINNSEGPAGISIATPNCVANCFATVILISRSKFKHFGIV
jgi:hypothetical protein